MDDGQYLRSVIPNFAGYENESKRRLSDEQVRAVAGRALALLGTQYPDLATGVFKERYEGLLLTCGFANQTAFKHIQHAQLSEQQLRALEAADTQLAQISERANQTDAHNVAAYLRDLEAALKARVDVMLGVAMPV